MYASLRMYESSAASESKVRSRDASGGSCSARSGEGAPAGNTSLPLRPGNHAADARCAVRAAAVAPAAGDDGATARYCPASASRAASTANGATVTAALLATYACVGADCQPLAAQMAAMTTAKSGGSSSSAAVVVGDRAASTTFLCTSAPH